MTDVARCSKQSAVRKTIGDRELEAMLVTGAAVIVEPKAHDALTSFGLPRSQWQGMNTDSHLERFIREIRRRPSLSPARFRKNIRVTETVRPVT